MIWIFSEQTIIAQFTHYGDIHEHVCNKESYTIESTGLLTVHRFTIELMIVFIQMQPDKTTG